MLTRCGQLRVRSFNGDFSQVGHIFTQQSRLRGAAAASGVDELIRAVHGALGILDVPHDAVRICLRGQSDGRVTGQAGNRDGRADIGNCAVTRIDSGNDRIRGGGVGGCIACHILLGQLLAALIYEGHDVVIGHGVHCDHAVFGDGRLLGRGGIIVGLSSNRNGGFPSVLRICSRNLQRIDILRCCSIRDRRLRHRIELAVLHFVQRNGSVKRIGVGHPAVYRLIGVLFSLVVGQRSGGIKIVYPIKIRRVTNITVPFALFVKLNVADIVLHIDVLEDLAILRFQCGNEVVVGHRRVDRHITCYTGRVKRELVLSDCRRTIRRAGEHILEAAVVAASDLCIQQYNCLTSIEVRCISCDIVL